jgi:quercetin dioxygenase-like cupin family protein
MGTVMATLLFLAVGGLQIAAAADRDVDIKPTEPRVTTLSKEDEAAVEGKKWQITTVELAPGRAYRRTLHSGEEVIYVLEGRGALKVDGKPPVALNAGTAIALHPKENRVITNTSHKQTLKVLFVQRLERERRHNGLANQGEVLGPAEQQTAPHAGLVF